MIAARRNLGHVLNQQGDVDGAMMLFRQVLELDPNDAMAHNNLGVALLQQGEVEEAIVHFSKALSIDPSYRTAQENLDRVQSK